MVNEVVTNVQIPAEDLETFEGRAKHLYTIRTEDGDFVKFTFNEAQEILHKIVEEEFERNLQTSGFRKCKIIVLKGRQVGATTYTAVRFTDEALLSNKYGLIATHTDDDTGLIYDKYQIVYDHLPDTVEIVKEGVVLRAANGHTKVPYKPDYDRYSAKTLKFQNMTQSWLMVRTAGSGDNLGKGTSYALLHFSEAGNYSHYRNVMSSTLQAVKDDMEQFIVVESTANGTTGIGRGFYEEWKRNSRDWDAFQRGELTSFDGLRPVFIPWWKMSKYRKPLVNGQFMELDGVDWGSEDYKKGYFEREQMLMDDYGVSKEHINWYRHCIKNKCQGSLMDAYRYYPCFADDAFIVTDNCFFDSLKLISEENKREVEQELLVYGNLDENVEFDPASVGDLAIKSFPEKNYMNRYIIGADVGRGYEDGDWTVFKVFDRLTDTWVARWKSKMAEDLAAFELMKLGEYYNEALIIVESNLATIINVIKPNGLYPYTGEVWAREFKNNGEILYGYLTTGAGRKPLIDSLQAFIRPDYGKLFDMSTVKEYRSFVRTVNSAGNVKYQADAGQHDDEVIADALCIHGRNNYDEELVELNKHHTDIVKFIKVKPPVSSGYKQSSIGKSFDDAVTVMGSKRQKQSGLGKR
jgi:hypothetical protein